MLPVSPSQFLGSFFELVTAFTLKQQHTTSEVEGIVPLVKQFTCRLPEALSPAQVLKTCSIENQFLQVFQFYQLGIPGPESTFTCSRLRYIRILMPCPFFVIRSNDLVEDFYLLVVEMLLHPTRDYFEKQLAFDC